MGLSRGLSAHCANDAGNAGNAAKAANDDDSDDDGDDNSNAAAEEAEGEEEKAGTGAGMDDIAAWINIAGERVDETEEFLKLLQYELVLGDIGTCVY